MRHTIFAAFLVTLALSSAAVARPRAITPEQAARFRELRAQIQPLRAAIRADLSAIKASGSVSREDLRGLGEAVAAAAADREFTDLEREHLKAQARAIADQVPAELREKLSADVEALADVLRSARNQ